jgi:hypothetical protein
MFPLYRINYFNQKIDERHERLLYRVRHEIATE